MAGAKPSPYGPVAGGGVDVLVVSGGETKQLMLGTVCERAKSTLLDSSSPSARNARAIPLWMQGRQKFACRKELNYCLTYTFDKSCQLVTWSKRLRTHSNALYLCITFLLSCRTVL